MLKQKNQLKNNQKKLKLDKNQNLKIKIQHNKVVFG